MELREPQRGFSLDALIAEAKRRARQRRLLIAVLLLAGAAVVAAVVVLGPSGGGSRSGGPAGGLGGASAGPQSVRVGALALTVPRGFYPDKIPCPIRHCRYSPMRVRVSNHAFTPASSQIYPANRVVLDVSYLGGGELASTRPPLNLHEFRQMGHVFGDGTAWSQIVSGGGSTYTVAVFEGRSTSAADRAAVLRALGSIRRAH